MGKGILILLVFLTAANASADSFTEVRDGREYFAEQSGLADDKAVERCVAHAVRGPFTQNEAQDLCKGAESSGPAECATQAVQGPFIKTEAFRLCKEALDAGPFDCAKKALNGPFSKAEALSLCESVGREKTADCAIRAKNGPYASSEAVRQCRKNPNVVIRSLNMGERSVQLHSQEDLLKRANRIEEIQ